MKKINILVAARNEEQHILACLTALNALDYPKEKLEIWIGDDNSQDRTFEIIKNFIADKNHFHLFRITETHKNLQGKANVLAQLSLKSSADFIFFTDADVEVPTTWIKAFLNNFDEKTGIITGITIPKNTSFFAKMQILDWISGLFLIFSASFFKIPITTMGNNMAVSQKAYDSVGGYANIPFSITEDYELFRQILAKKWDFKQLANPEIVAKTQAIPDLKTLLEQRKRWATGAMKIPIYIKIPLILHILYFLILILWAFISFQACVKFFFVKFVIDWIFIAFFAKKIKQTSCIIFFPFYVIYSLFFNTILFFYYLLPQKIVWKGRHY